MSMNLRKEALNRNDIANTVSKLTGGRPLLAALGSGAGLGALSYIIGPWAAKKFLIPKGYQLTPREEARIKRRFGMLGFGLGSAAWLPAIYKNVKDKGFMKGLFGKYGKPEVKKAEYIPFQDSFNMAMSDEFLGPAGKRVMAKIFDEAGRHASLRRDAGGTMRGMLTTKDLIAGGVGAGLGYGGGTVVGEVLSKVFALPPPTVRRMSRAGALAGLLYGTGVIG